MTAFCSTRSRRGFSLVEILVVVSVIGVMAAISIPAYQGVMRATKNTESEDFVESLNRAVRSFSLGNWDLPVVPDNAATTDEYAALRSLQFRWPASSLKPGSPYFSPKYNPQASNSTGEYRLRWNGRTFEVLRPGTVGSGLLKTFAGADYTAADYVFPNGYKPPGSR